MSEPSVTERPPMPDLSTITDKELIAYREAENRFRASSTARAITGEPDPDAAIQWRQVALSGRQLPVRVYRPSSNSEGGLLPLVLHVHGGGFVGTAVQSDWVNSHLAAQLPALVVSVEHRLLDAGTSLAAAAEDGWEVLQHVLRHAADWGVDPARTAVFGESNGAMIIALAAIRAKASGLGLRAQVLVNPGADLTDTMFDYPSMAEYGDSQTMTELRLVQRLAVPPGADARAVSPLFADDLSGLAPTLVVVPTADAAADHGRSYAERLRESGTPTRLAEHPGAPHAFLSMPGRVPQAKTARAEITEFLRGRINTNPAIT